MRAGAALTTTGRAGTARRRGSGKQDEKVHERNQRLKPRKSSTGSNLADMGRGAARDHRWEAGLYSGAGWFRRRGGHGEGLRRSRGDAAGAGAGRLTRRTVVR